MIEVRNTHLKLSEKENTGSINDGNRKYSWVLAKQNHYMDELLTSLLLAVFHYKQYMVYIKLKI